MHYVNVRVKILVIAFVIALLLSGFGSNIYANNKPQNAQSTQTRYWPMFQHNLRHTGYTTLTGNLSPSLIETKWTFSSFPNLVSFAAIGDINNDSKAEVVFGSEDKHVYAMNGEDGSQLWSYDGIKNGGAMPTIGDLNNDGMADVVFVSKDKHAYALNGKNGSLLWNFETGKGNIAIPPSIADVNKDGIVEVILVCYHNYSSSIKAVNGQNGNVTWSRSFCTDISSPAVADIDNDGTLEVIVGGGRDVAVINGENGSFQWHKQIASEAWFSSPAIADINGDGNLDIIIGSGDFKLYALNGENGSILWSFYTGGEIWGSPAVGDINSDGILEVVIKSRDGSYYAINGSNGNELWRYNTNGYDNSPVIADINGDGKLEVLVDKAILNGKNGSVLWKGTLGTPSVGDVDNDGEAEIVTWDFSDIAVLDSSSPNHPPVVSISNPSNGETVSGTITINGMASDPDEGDIVEKVEVKIDSGWHTASGTTSWSYEWDSTAVENGLHIIYARAWDGQNYSNIVQVNVSVENQFYTLTTSVDPSGSGSIALDPSGGVYNEGTVVTVTANANSGYEFDYWSRDASGNDATIQITMNSDKSITAHFVVKPSPPPENNPPAISISNPSNGQVVSGTITINGTASDPDGNEELVKVEIKIDGSWHEATGKTLWSYEWDTTTVENGNHTIYARSYDGEDYSTTKSVTIKVFNNHPPIVNITSPINGSKVNGTIIINGTASDEDGNETIQKVEIKIDDGEWKVANGTTSWNYTWDTISVKNGKHTIYAKAWDGTDYSSIDSIEIEVKNKKEEESIPGFEFAFLIIAIAIILLKRRHKRNQ